MSGFNTTSCPISEPSALFLAEQSGKLHLEGAPYPLPDQSSHRNDHSDHILAQLSPGHTQVPNSQRLASFGGWLLAAGCWMLAGCWLWLGAAVCCVLFTGCCSLLAASLLLVGGW